MEYYQAEKYLVSRIKESNLFIIKNMIGVKEFRLTKDQFMKLHRTPLQKERFNELLNAYYRNVKETWTYEGVRYKAMENFETDKDGNCINYDLDKRIPKHYLNIEGKLTEVLFVYHQSRVYYLQWSSKGDTRGRLIDATTFDLLKWVRPRNCSPVMNLDKRQIK